MTNTLQEAIAALRDLPPSLQDEVGADLLGYVKRLDALKREIQIGLDDVEQGRARPLTDDLWREIKAKALAGGRQSQS
jgi:hypothetical protein